MQKLNLKKTLQDAILAHKRGDLQKAAKLYGTIIDVVPNHPDANHNLGLVYKNLDEGSKALTHFSTAIKSNKNVSQYWISLINLQIQLKKYTDANATLKEADNLKVYDLRIEKLRASLKKIANSDISTLNNQSFDNDLISEILELFQQKCYAAVIDETQKTLSIFPNQAQLWNIQGAAYAAIKEFEKSIASYDEAIKLQPGFYQVYNNKGVVQKDTQDFNGAISSYEKALELNPKFAQAHYNKGVALSKIRKFKDAISSYDKAIETKPGFAEAYNNKGTALKEIGELKKAIKNFDQALTLNPKYTEAINNKGIALKELSLFDDAIHHFNKALTIEPKNEFGSRNLLNLLKYHNNSTSYSNTLILLNSEIRKNRKLLNMSCSFEELSREISDYILRIPSYLKLPNTQLFVRTDDTLNCERHFKIFNEHKIIPQFCFGCYKLQLDIKGISTLIRVAQFFYSKKFTFNVIRKCMIEMRTDVSGTFKALIYCRSIDELLQIRQSVNNSLHDYNSVISYKLKRGCTEFSLAYPGYEKINPEHEMMLYTAEWNSIELDFDRENEKIPIGFSMPSKRSFCLEDIIIISKWIDYGKGCGDPQAQYFEKLPVFNKDIYNLASARLQN